MEIRRVSPQMFAELRKDSEFLDYTWVTYAGLPVMGSLRGVEYVRRDVLKEEPMAETMAKPIENTFNITINATDAEGILANTDKIAAAIQSALKLNKSPEPSSPSPEFMRNMFDDMREERKKTERLAEVSTAIADRAFLERDEAQRQAKQFSDKYDNAQQQVHYFSTKYDEVVKERDSMRAALPFNKLTPAEDERLACLSEEMGEVIQAIGKIQRHGYDSTNPDVLVGGPNNRETLAMELGHVVGCAIRLLQGDDISGCLYEDAKNSKSRSTNYLHHQGPVK